MITSMFLACHPALYSHLMHSRVTVCRFAFEFLKHFWFHAQAKQQIEETLLRNRKMVQALCIDTSTFTYVAWSCCFWRKVPTEPQQEGQRFTLQDGHLATPRIQDWKSWQLQSLHMVTWYIANHNKGFQTMTTPSSFDISRAGPGSGEFYLWVIYLLSGIGRGSEAQLDPDKPGFGWQQDWSFRGSGLVFGWGWWGCWGIDHEGGRYCSRDPDRANGQWNGEMSERKNMQRIGAEMCQVHHADLSEIWACSFHFIADHMICDYQRKYESMR